MIKERTYFLYLHGFNGSPNSQKAQKIIRWIKKNFKNVLVNAPLLKMDVASVLSTISNIIDYNSHKYNINKKIIIGSSLGGYIAHIIKQNRNDISKVVLINPVSRLDLILKKFPKYFPIHTEALKILNFLPKNTSFLRDYLILLQEDDVITPAYHAIKFFKGASIDIKSGQGHHYNNIEVSFKNIKNFLNNYIT